MYTSKTVGGRAANKGKIVTTGLFLASLLLPFKANSESIKSVNEYTPNSELVARIYLQKGKERTYEIGIGFSAILDASPLKIGLDAGISSGILDRNSALEQVGVKVLFPIVPDRIGGTIYAQRSMFLGGQHAVGGVLHAPIDSFTLAIGVEKDVNGPTPIFASADLSLDGIALSATVIMPTIPEKDYPNLGGTAKIGWKKKFGNLFARFFGMTNPSEQKILAANAQAGIEIPLK